MKRIERERERESKRDRRFGMISIYMTVLPEKDEMTDER